MIPVFSPPDPAGDRGYVHPVAVLLDGSILISTRLHLPFPLVSAIDGRDDKTDKIPEKIRSRQPQIEWKNIIGIRNIITHAYFAIDDEVVWDIIQTKLDPLQSCIQQILETEDLENYTILVKFCYNSKRAELK